VPQNIISDPFRLRQVVSNLINNAIKYTPEGSITARFTAIGDQGNKRIRFTVKDTGTGIPLDAQKTIFDKFTQIDRKESINGTGLGLPICRSLIELMGGQVDVESDGQNGSLFWFEIPLVNAPDNTLTDRRMEIIFTRANHAGCKVLLVEDIEMNRIVAAEMLRQLGCVVDSAENGRIAVDTLAHTAYDIVFMDCNMPVMNGYDATQAIRDSGDTKTPIVALTAHTMQEEIDKCLNAGMNDFLSKPIRHDQLTRALDKWHNPSSIQPLSLTEINIQPPASEVITFDTSTLQEWYSSNPEKARKFIELTLKDSARIYDELCQALSANDADELREAAHALKSVSAQIGGLKMSQLSKEMEMLGKSRDTAQAHENLPLFEATYANFIETIKTFSPI